MSVDGELAKIGLPFLQGSHQQRSLPHDSGEGLVIGRCDAIRHGLQDGDQLAYRSPPALIPCVEIVDKFAQRQNDLVDHLATAVPRRRFARSISERRVFDIAIGHVAHRMEEEPPSRGIDPYLAVPCRSQSYQSDHQGEDEGK